jgi:hypothetical protein
MHSFARSQSIPISRMGSVVLIFSIAVSCITSRASADVVVIANRTTRPVPFRVVHQTDDQRPITVAARDLVTLNLNGGGELLFEVGGNLVRYHLDANAGYYFAVNEKGWLDLNKINLGGDDTTFGGRELDAKKASAQQGEISVKIVVDKHELTPRTKWESRVRKRIDAVSDILQRSCQLRLKVVAVEQWDSGDQPTEFRKSFVRFQQQIDPHPARLAIGFTSRPQQDQKILRLGTTRGMLQSHILVREWSSKMIELERVEVLLHEVGHFLGAIHSPDPESVMRSILGDDKVIHRDFRIRFDAVNSLIINMIGEEIRHRPIATATDLSIGTKTRLAQIYETLAKAIPEDDSPRKMASQLNLVAGASLHDATRSVLRAINRAAHERSGAAESGSPTPVGDQLTEFFVRRAALAAKVFPDDIAPRAMLLALGIAMDESGLLLRTPVARELCQAVESPAQRQQRKSMMGRPTIRDRSDLVQHFFLSAHLTALVGAAAAESAGNLKEMSDGRSDSGFSYVDLTANLSGIAFAKRLLQNDLKVTDIAERFAIDHVMPPITDLPEGLPWSKISSGLTDGSEKNWAYYRREIDRRIRNLPGQKELPAKASQ